MTGKPFPINTIKKPILQTPARPTPKRLATPKSVRMQSDTTNDLPVTEPDPTLMKTPVMVHGGARPKTPRMDGTPLAPSIINPSHSQTQPLIPRRILSSTPLGENGEEIDKRSELIRNVEERRILEEKRKMLEEQNRKIFHPTCWPRRWRCGSFHVCTEVGQDLLTLIGISTGDTLPPWDVLQCWQRRNCSHLNLNCQTLRHPSQMSSRG